MLLLGKEISEKPQGELKSCGEIMKPLYCVLTLLIMTMAAQAEEITVLHYNIKELDSHKIQTCEALFDLGQLEAAGQIIRQINPDFFSINEMQYDLPGVPNSQFKSRGENVDRFLEKVGVDFDHISFNPANTGMKAKKDENGNYVRKPGPGQTDRFADPVNFGLFPGQYSTAGASRFPIKKEVVLTELPIKVFNPDFDPTKFQQKDGKPLPADMELFDKNFTDITLDVAGEEVHFILLHTVPGFGFGNPNSINPQRNYLQLAFLEWYLTGKTDFPVPRDIGVEPLKPGSKFIALGDWNVDSRDENPGAQVINRLGEAFKYWLPTPEVTYRSQSFRPEEFTRQFDYILVGPGFEIVASGAVRPEAKRIERGCKQKPDMPIPPGFVRIRYQNEAGQNCFADVAKDYAVSKTGSDHIAIWSKLRLIR